ncbi:MAG TPA: DUF1330 domain-containing protein [Oceanospirillales bacterium]|nr:DUF1330 domain-containing protein [Oceanospirillales bacterium]
MTTYIHPTDEAAAAFFSQQHSGDIVMLNLLKFKQIADYSDTPELSTKEQISGENAYKLYMQHTAPFLQESGGEVLFYGTASEFFIGPSDESWDVVMLVKQKSIQHFIAFASNEDYLAGIGHRTAALADSRLLPIKPQSI